MKKNLLFMLLSFAPMSLLACDLENNTDIPKEMIDKLRLAGNEKLVPCESLKSVMAMYSNKFVAGGRRLEPVGAGRVDKGFCKNPRWAKRIREANKIEDQDVRAIVIAAILDDAGQDAARDMVIGNPGLNPCPGK